MGHDTFFLYCTITFVISVCASQLQDEGTHLPPHEARPSPDFWNLLSCFSSSATFRETSLPSSPFILSLLSIHALMLLPPWLCPHHAQPWTALLDPTSSPDRVLTSPHLCSSCPPSGLRCFSCVHSTVGTALAFPYGSVTCLLCALIPTETVRPWRDGSAFCVNLIFKGFIFK